MPPHEVFLNHPAIKSHQALPPPKSLEIQDCLPEPCLPRLPCPSGAPAPGLNLPHNRAVPGMRQITEECLAPFLLGIAQTTLQRAFM